MGLYRYIGRHKLQTLIFFPSCGRTKLKNLIVFALREIVSLGTIVAPESKTACSVRLPFHRQVGFEPILLIDKIVAQGSPFVKPPKSVLESKVMIRSVPLVENLAEET